MTDLEGEKRYLTEIEYKQRLGSIVDAFRVALSEYQDYWRAGIDPAEALPTPVTGIVIFGSYGDGTATTGPDLKHQSDVDINVLLDSSEITVRDFSSITDYFIGILKNKLFDRKLKLDETYEALNIQDPGDLLLNIGKYWEETNRPIVIMYNDQSDMRQVVEPVVTSLGMECTWIPVSV